MTSEATSSETTSVDSGKHSTEISEMKITREATLSRHDLLPIEVTAESRMKTQQRNTTTSEVITIVTTTTSRLERL